MTHGILFQMIVYLAAAVVCVPIAKRLRMGSVLGYLVAGMLIGPSVLGFVGEEGGNVMHFAEFGVVVMLFLVGLELEPSRFWAMKGAVLGLGSLQVGGTALLLTGAGLALGLDWRAALAAALALSMSSTAIALQSLKEKGMMQTPAGRQSFAVLLFQDISVIPILALLPMIAVAQEVSGGGHGGGLPVDSLAAWQRALLVFTVVAVVIAAGRWAVVPMLRLVARTRLRELFIASALLLVVGVAWLMQMVGLSPALGTFLAGVVLSDSEFRHELESDLDPFKGLLLGLFFIAVGASIDFRLLADMPLQVAAWTLGVVALKMLVLSAIAKLSRSALDQNLVFSVGLSQVGEFAFVLVSFVVGLGLVSSELAALLVAVTALSMVLTPLLGLAVDTWIMPRLVSNENPEREADAIDEHNAVIIAGFSHFGSTVGRFLRANGIEATILDNDSTQVEFLRRMGFRAYYGDATRADLLETAGAADARYLLCAIDAPETTRHLVETVQKHFPHLRLLVRVQNRFEAYDLMDLGVKDLYRETLHTSVRMGVDLLRLLGRPAHTAHRNGQNFLRYDECAFWELAAHKCDSNLYIQNARQSIRMQEELIRNDLEHKPSASDSAWDSEPLRAGSTKSVATSVAPTGLTPGGPA